MVYLLYVSRDAETLQFFLWLKDYTRRFNRLTEHEASLSPEWYPATRPGTKLHKLGTRNNIASEVLSHTLLSKESFETSETISEKKCKFIPRHRWHRAHST